MGNRQRLTWDKGAATPDKEASPPPQIPANDRTEKSEHPAAQPDPDYAKYKEGDPSAWAEDIHPGPYDTAAAPATPGYREPADHPAAKPGKPMSASDQSEEEIRRTTELKAAKCIRVATIMLGDPAEGVAEEQHVAAIEAQALDLMDLPEDQLRSTLERLGMADEEEADKEASMDITARLDRLESGLERIAEKIGIAGNLFGQMDEPYMEEDLLETPTEEDAMLEDMLAQDEPVVEEDAMLEEMLAQDDDLDDDEEEMLAAMLCGRTAADDEEEKEEEEEEKEGGKKAEEEKQAEEKEAKKSQDEDEEADEDKESACKQAEEKEAEEKEASLDIQLEDPMGLMDTSAPSSDSDLELLYRTAEDDENDKGGKPEKGKIPPQFEKKDKDEEKAKEEEDKAEEKEEEAQDEGEKEGGKKAAALRPQPKEPSTGAQALGTVQKSASSEIGDLSSLWEHAPDVSSVFK